MPKTLEKYINFAAALQPSKSIYHREHKENTMIIKQKQRTE